MKKCITTGAILLVLAFTLAAASFAWFSVDKIIDFPDSYGAIDSAAYFAGGDGTQGNPYIINSPVHLYNLAWLQYLGYFNMKDGFNNGVAQNYFTLAGNIDMSGMCLPPIGTEEYPFVGIFNGNGKIISDINVSNKKDTNNITQHPTNAVFENNILQTTTDTPSDKQDIQIVGLFGVVGDYNKYVSGETEGYSVGKNKDEKDLDKKFDTAEMSVSGFYIDNLHVKTHSSKTLVGLIAGYVGANVKNTGVYRCDITAGNSSALGLDGNACISKYSIVGDYDANIVQWKELQNVAGTPGQEAAWGGSIGIKGIVDRLNDFTYSEESYSVGSKSYYYYEGKNGEGSVARRLNGLTTYIANIEGKQPTNIPLNVNGSQQVINTNTGYIVAGSREGRVRFGKKSIKGGLSNSLQDPTKKYEENYLRLKIYTQTATSKGVKLIQDSYHEEESEKRNYYGLQKYEYYENNQLKGGRSNLHSLLLNADDVYGLHFMEESIGKDSISKVKSVNIFGNVKENYQLVNYSINFNLKQEGYISFFAGTYYTTVNQNFFSLHKVERDTNDEIINIREIYKIYKNKTGGGYCYSYYNESEKKEYFDEGIENGDLIFDMSWITKEANKINALYYFEIPVNAGEYALGSCSSGNGAYLMYLDIGANGSGDDGTTEVPSDAPYTISYLDFVSPAGNNDLAFPTEKDEKGEYIPAYDDVIFALSDVTNTEAIVWFKRESWTEGANPVSTVVLYYSTYITVAPTPTDKAKEDPTLNPTNTTN